MPLLYTDERFLAHDTGQHPECPERLRALFHRFETSEIAQKFDRGTIVDATPQQLGRIHEQHYIKLVREFAARGGGHIDADTVCSHQSFEVARLAAGAAVSAVDAVLSGPHRQAVCLVRPPGHHARSHTTMGFCLFNNVAVAAAHARAVYGLERILIVDWDVHHGNGTQDAFYSNPHVYFLSVHRYPFYPGTGAENETGTGPGLGTIFNLPLPFGTPRKQYRARFDALLTAAADRCKPQLVLISAGFDAHAADPIGSLGLETEDYEWLTRLPLEVAQQCCGGRLVSLLEGGYNVRVLPDCVECHMEAILKSQPAGTNP